MTGSKRHLGPTRNAPKGPVRGIVTTQPLAAGNLVMVSAHTHTHTHTHTHRRTHVEMGSVLAIRACFASTGPIGTDGRHSCKHSCQVFKTRVQAWYGHTHSANKRKHRSPWYVDTPWEARAHKTLCVWAWSSFKRRSPVVPFWGRIGGELP